jgi:putative Mg2+ transporter-C (MgtC) family protein
MLLTPDQQEILLKLILAMLLGGAMGFQREIVRSPAGIKTYSIVCIGSALFTMVSALTDIRIAAGVISGIGFLGAAVVFRNENRVTGLTTAALIWSTAAIGFVIGTGYYFAAIVTSLMIIFILIGVEYFEIKVLGTHDEKALWFNNLIAIGKKKRKKR